MIAGRIARDLKEIDEDLKSLLQGNEKLKEEGIIDKLTAKDIQNKIQQHRRSTKELGIVSLRISLTLASFTFSILIFFIPLFIQI